LRIDENKKITTRQQRVKKITTLVKKKGYCFFARLFKYSKIIAVKTATFLTQSR
jgi:hypothetical protein